MTPPTTTPRFWEYCGLASGLLQPVARIYQCITFLHERSQKPPYRAPAPVLCVGNAVAGGAGKTPVALALAQRVIDRKPEICLSFLTRGYGGSVRGPRAVRLPDDSAADVGDEALLLAQVRYSAASGCYCFRARYNLRLTIVLRFARLGSHHVAVRPRGPRARLCQDQICSSWTMACSTIASFEICHFSSLTPSTSSGTDGCFLLVRTLPHQARTPAANPGYGSNHFVHLMNPLALCCPNGRPLSPAPRSRSPLHLRKRPLLR
eukprot:2752486-Pleurochrysis_carterae.AAC.2